MSNGQFLIYSLTIIRPIYSNTSSLVTLITMILYRISKHGFEIKHYITIICEPDLEKSIYSISYIKSSPTRYWDMVRDTKHVLKT